MGSVKATGFDFAVLQLGSNYSNEQVFLRFFVLFSICSLTVELLLLLLTKPARERSTSVHYSHNFHIIVDVYQH